MVTLLVIKITGFSVFFSLAGILIIRYAYLFYALATRLKRNGVKTKAEIIDVKIEPMGETEAYHPTLQFTTLDNRRIRVTVSGHSWSCCRKGDVVNIIYDRDGPGAVLSGNGGYERFFEPSILALIGLGVICYGFTI